jgi:hypothetical protein
VFRQKLNLINAFTAIAITSSCPVICHAQEAKDKNGFYQKNMAVDFFSANVMKENESDRYNILRPKERSPVGVEDPTFPAEEDARAEAEKAETQADPKAVAADDSQLSPAEKILKQYGDPNADAPVTAVDTAPGPFKAMMAALQANDDDLAYRYAKQWVRHVQNVNDRTQKVVNFTQMAMESEGLADPGSSGKSPYRYLLNRDLKNGSLIANNEYLGSVDQRALSLISRAQAGTLNSGVTEEDVRAQSKMIVDQRNLPTDPNGQVDVYFFLSINDKDRDSISMLGEIDRFFKENGDNKEANMAGFTLEPATDEQIRHFKQRYRIDFPIVDGHQMAKEFQIPTSPATVFVPRSTQEPFLEPGLRNFFYLDEVLRKVQGRRD